jgi:drug/metabolite transporter (DMT)-like permease
VPAIIFIFSLIFLGEKATIRKVAAVVLAIGGVAFIVSSGDSIAKAAGADSGNDPSTPLEKSAVIVGYVLAIVCTIGTAMYELLYDYLVCAPDAARREAAGGGGGGDLEMSEHMAPINDSSDTIDDLKSSLRIIGTMGVCVILIFWPLFIVLHYTEAEVFTLPDKTNALSLAGNAAMFVVYNLLLVFGISLTSPLFISTGMLLTIPGSLIVDQISRSTALNWRAYVGSGLIIVGFFLLGFGTASAEQRNDTPAIDKSINDTNHKLDDDDSR